MLSSIANKTRAPKFRLELEICELINVIQTKGRVYAKWKIRNSPKQSSRGRTEKAPIVHHAATWNHHATTTVRIPMDRTKTLQERHLVIQLFLDESGVAEQVSHVNQGTPGAPGAPGTHGTHGTHGNHVNHVDNDSKHNLAVPGKGKSSSAASIRSNGSSSSTTGKPHSPKAHHRTALGRIEINLAEHADNDELTANRYLLQDSRTNSILTVRIAMELIKGETEYIVPPMSSAQMFGSITGVLTGVSEERHDIHMKPLLSEPVILQLAHRALQMPFDDPTDKKTAHDFVEEIFAGANGGSGGNGGNGGNGGSGVSGVPPGGFNHRIASSGSPRLTLRTPTESSVDLQWSSPSLSSPEVREVSPGVESLHVVSGTSCGVFDERELRDDLRSWVISPVE